jgi:hypothetical protein
VLDPGLEAKIVFLTGGALGERTRRFASSIPNRFLEKPVERTELERAVIDAARQPGDAS